MIYIFLAKSWKSHEALYTSCLSNDNRKLLGSMLAKDFLFSCNTSFVSRSGFQAISFLAWSEMFCKDRSRTINTSSSIFSTLSVLSNHIFIPSFNRENLSYPASYSTVVMILYFWLKPCFKLLELDIRRDWTEVFLGIDCKYHFPYFIWKTGFCTGFFYRVPFFIAQNSVKWLATSVPLEGLPSFPIAGTLTGDYTRGYTWWFQYKVTYSNKCYSKEQITNKAPEYYNHFAH